ncbi:Atg14 domain-containing protein [Pelagibacteraceae bacterium]|jgi:chromosome segregation ATPase|nr:Atg14 domain-containing protein [Pelagibacteraceae bacterium]
MPDLEVNVFNQKLKLSYLEDEKERLTNAINILNESWKKFSNLHGKVSDLKIITLISLELQDSIGDYEDQIKLQKKNIDLLKQEIEEKNNDLQNMITQVNKLKLEIEIKEKEISKTEIVLDEINHELSQIKNNILAHNDE